MRELAREHTPDPTLAVVGGRCRPSQKIPVESDFTDAGPSLSDRCFFLVSLRGAMDDWETEQKVPRLSLNTLNVSRVGDSPHSPSLLISPVCMCSNSSIVSHSWQRALSQTRSSATVLNGGWIGLRYSGQGWLEL